ncbi:hypothetical protein GUJ93_ZPchr0006g46462 [Zizania palustris]|uniref:Uncharacterized protein n=1 Tax=Zizania palustris TaxID=103762 RepID=A0A8J5W3Y3_ZIZPA|nr:hypothetical protein GUJ93_ZPchr0006g46462 [Zizania palustris]
MVGLLAPDLRRAPTAPVPSRLLAPSPLTPRPLASHVSRPSCLPPIVSAWEARVGARVSRWAWKPRGQGARRLVSAGGEGAGRGRAREARGRGRSGARGEGEREARGCTGVGGEGSWGHEGTKGEGAREARWAWAREARGRGCAALGRRSAAWARR